MDRQREYGEVLPASSRQRKLPKRKRSAGERPTVSRAPGGPQIPYQRPRKGRVARIVFGVAFIVLVLAILGLGAIVFSYWQGQRVYDEVAQDAFPSADDVFAQGAVGSEAAGGVDLEAICDAIDWDALRAVNPDVVAWIYVPGTPVNYPVVQTSNNVTYLSTDFRGGHGWLAQFGCIFVAAENAPGFTDRNNVLFGHHMNDGSMFGFIDGLFDPDKFNATRDIYLLSPDGGYRLRTFSILHCDANEAIAQTTFPSDEDYAAYVQDKMDRSEVAPDPAMDAASVQKTFMLATCDNAVDSLRQVLFAVVEESTVPANMGAVNDVQPALDEASAFASP